jgi:hypothetical protein
MSTPRPLAALIAKPLCGEASRLLRANVLLCGANSRFHGEAEAPSPRKRGPPPKAPEPRLLKARKGKEAKEAKDART